MIQLLVFVFTLATLSHTSAHHHRLSKPLVGDDGRVYVCSNKKLLAFESNGSISWTMHIDYRCNVGMAPVHGGFGKIYLIAENRILRVKLENSGTSEPAAELFFGPEPGQQVETEIIGLSVSTLTSTVFINIKNRGLFAYQSQGRLLWSIGPVLYKFGYRQGCRKNVTDCSFASVPVLDQCEGSIYVSNTEGQLYCLYTRGRHFRWIQDFSYLDRNFTITPGNNGRLYVTIPARELLLALDVFSGNVLWQRSIGPLSKADSVPVVDSNGWVSIRPKVALLTMLVPATGSIYWSENNPGQLTSSLSKSNLSQFVVDEEILLAFLAASKTGNLLQCRTRDQKLASKCSQARTKLVSIYTGNETVIPLFLLFEITVLAILIGLVRFCCSFWAKKKLQDQGLGSFLAKRSSLQLQKKALDRTITELDEKPQRKQWTERF